MTLPPPRPFGPSNGKTLDSKALVLCSFPCNDLVSPSLLKCIRPFFLCNPSALLQLKWNMSLLIGFLRRGRSDCSRTESPLALGLSSILCPGSYYNLPRLCKEMTRLLNYLTICSSWSCNEGTGVLRSPREIARTPIILILGPASQRLVIKCKSINSPQT
jgi:hypothetical protein